VYDVIDFLINQVMRSGGEVDIVMANADLEKAGCIGAVLRY